MTHRTNGLAQSFAHVGVLPDLSFLRPLRATLADRSGRFVRLMMDEVGKPEDEALAADVLPLLAAIKWHEKHARRVLRERSLAGRPLWMIGQRHRVRRVPLGRVGIIATWNYPLQLLGVQLVQALVCGNRVMVKPSEHAPRTQHAFLELIRELLDDPRGDRLTWTEPTREAGRQMLADRDAGGFDHVIFTGSTGVGRAIAETLAPRLVPSTLELSGRDSALVLDDADPALAARGIWHAVALNAGQTCMAPRRALVHRDAYVRFVRALAPLVSSAPARRLINAEAAEHTFAAAVSGIEAGGRSLSGILERPSGDDGRTLRPLAIVDCPADAPLVAGDHFGPAIAVVCCDSLDEMLAIHHACPQHLATSVYSNNTRRARALASRLLAGVVTINDTLLPTGHPAGTLGGKGESGWGHTRGEEGLRALSRPVTVSTTSRRFRIPVGPPPPNQASRLRSLMGLLYVSGSDNSANATRTPSATTPASSDNTTIPAPSPTASRTDQPR